MRAIIFMLDSLNRHMLSPYADTVVDAPNFARLAAEAVTFDNFYAGSMPCIPARRELHTGRYNFLHRAWGPLEPFDDSMPEMLRSAGIHTHLVSDHPHYWEDGGATFHTRYSTWEFFRGQEGDPWKGVVSDESDSGAGFYGRMRRQDQINRTYMSTEAEHSQTRTVEAGLHFLETNVAQDKWLLQIEIFDPHEPFFVPASYVERYPDTYDGPEFDWPTYQKVTEPAEMVEHARMKYAALVSMCDRSLGRVLDFMDRHDMWSDTLLIVNTDHGFLLGEHGWWAKSVQPWFNELVHLPMFMWDPRSAGRDERRGALAQTIDIAPTVLRYFGIEPTPDMQGKDLAAVLEDDVDVRSSALFGIHGGHINVTDGRYVYMRAPVDRSNAPLEEFTLMPTRMRARFSTDELADWRPTKPFTFTKGLRTMRIPTKGSWMNPWLHGSLLFDLETDPRQETPMVDDEVELRMVCLLVEQMRANDAPASQYERLGLPVEEEPGPEHLLVKVQRERAAETAEPLDRIRDLPGQDLIAAPILELLGDPAARAVLDRHVPELAGSELLTLSPEQSLLGLARHASVSWQTLHKLAVALSELGS